MKKTFLLISLLLLSLSFSIFTTAQTWKWAVGSICPKGSMESWPIAVDRSGNVYGSGNPQSFTGSGLDSIICIFGTDTIFHPHNMVIASTDSDGHYRWAMGATSGTYSEITSIATDIHNNIYLFGFYGYDLTLGGLSTSSGGYNSFCAKINSSGGVQWLKSTTSGSTFNIGGVDTLGNVYIAGNFYSLYLNIGTITLNNASTDGMHSDIYVTKLDSFGNPIWAKSFGGDSSEGVSAIAITSDGKVCLSGYYKSHVFPLGATNLTYPFAGVNPNLFVLKLDTGGNVSWAKQANAGGLCRPRSIALDIWDNLYFGGGFDSIISFGTYSLSYNPYYSMFLAKYDKNGILKWAKESTYNEAFDVAADIYGNVLVCGPGAPGISNIDEAHILRFDSSGVLQDSIFLPCGGDDLMGITVDNKGSFYICGDYFNNFNIVGHDTLRLVDSSGETFFLAKYSYPTSSTRVNTMFPITRENNIIIYPNPASDEFTIASDNYSTLISEIEIFDITGRLMLMEKPGSSKTTILIDKLKPGFYTCKIFSGDNDIFIDKLIVR